MSGSFFAGEYAWYLLAAAVVAYPAEGRVPDLAPAHMALRLSSYTWTKGGESGETERASCSWKRLRPRPTRR
ncbi:MAG: hypothetical protein OHK0022_16900 [Roseiflexaceae bacterium]